MISKNQFDSYINTAFREFNSQNRLNVFDYLPMEKCPDDELIKIYSSADIPMRQKHYKKLMNEIEKRSLKINLPRIVKIHRGTSKETMNRFGLGNSWTLNFETAKQFSQICCSSRYKMVFGTIDENPFIVSLIVFREEIIAHITDRNEDEVLITNDAVQRVNKHYQEPKTNIEYQRSYLLD